MAHIIDGKALASHLMDQLRPWVARFTQTYGTAPNLTVVRVGHDPASAVYVNAKKNQASTLGLDFRDVHITDPITQDALQTYIQTLSHTSDVHGMIVQLPLPSPLQATPVLQCIAPEKDVDGLHPLNSGLLFQGSQEGFVPCTPLGCLFLLKSILPSLSGIHVAIVGRSILVGRPLAALLLTQDCTVTTLHSQSVGIAGHIRRADIVIAAIGKPHFIKGPWLKEGAIVLDVGINRIINAIGHAALCGDVDFGTALDHVRAITPVPGGVGPMTVACLMHNTVKSAYRSKGTAWSLPDPQFQW